MAVVSIIISAFLASLLTLFSGFGLGTLLMPVVAIFFSVPVAVAMTAVVHLLNNLFKLALLWRRADYGIVLRFGLPALAATVPGALLLDALAGLPPLYGYTLAGRAFEVTPVKLAAGLLLILFATAEWLPLLKRLPVSRASLPLGGVLSGFFGGLSGHQGAFRSAFLIRTGLDKDSFVATNAAIASLVDITRIVVYGFSFGVLALEEQASLVLLATAAAFAGVFLGTRLLRKVTIAFIQRLVAAMLYLLGLALCAGVI